jgi:hypothetical protein
MATQVTRHGHNNRHFGKTQGVRYSTAEKLKQRRESGKKTTYTYPFILDTFIFEQINIGTLMNDDTASQFTLQSNILDVTAGGAVTVLIHTEKAWNEVSKYDLLEAVEADPNIPITGLVWHSVTNPTTGVVNEYLEGATINGTSYPDTGTYVDAAGNPAPKPVPDGFEAVKWVGESWMGYEPNPNNVSNENPNGAPLSMAEYSEKTFDEEMLFKSDPNSTATPSRANQNFTADVMSYTGMNYTWTQ